ncbi:hypothetical protein [Janibacter melonis]
MLEADEQAGGAADEGAAEDDGDPAAPGRVPSAVRTDIAGRVGTR